MTPNHLHDPTRFKTLFKNNSNIIENTLKFIIFYTK